MANIQIVVAEESDAYAAQLELALLKELSPSADVHVITDHAYFKAYFHTPQKVDLLLINESFFYPALKRHAIGRLVFLSEDEQTGKSGRTESGERAIYKYGSLQEMIRRIRQLVQDLSGPVAQWAPKTICVYSPVGGMGSTTVSLGLAAALGKGKKEAIYINTETIQSFQTLLEDTKEVLSAEFRERLLSKSEISKEMITPSCGEQGFDYLLPFEYSPTTYGITTKHFVHLIDELCRQKKYQYIIVDCSSEFTQDKSLLMSRCSQVVVLTGQDRLSAEKTRQFLSTINTQGGERFLFVCNRYEANRENLLPELMPRVNIKEHIPYVPEEKRRDANAIGRLDTIARLAVQLS